MENLTVEYLPNYKQYRLWNSDYEDWFTNKKDLIRTCKDHKDNFTYTTYGTPELVKDFKKCGVILKDKSLEEELK